MAHWTVPRLWPGETAFIVAGGPSVAPQNTDVLSGRKVIAINSSYERVPFAQYLIFADLRWWQEHRRKITFAGEIVAANAEVGEARVKCVKRRLPPGLSDSPDTLTVQWTTLTAAIGMAVHLGTSRIVLLGADNKRGDNGRCHHHAPHKWPLKDNLLAKQRDEVGTLVSPLIAKNVQVVNCSPGSALPFWPIMALADYLKTEA